MLQRSFLISLFGIFQSIVKLNKQLNLQGQNLEITAKRSSLSEPLRPADTSVTETSFNDDNEIYISNIPAQ